MSDITTEEFNRLLRRFDKLVARVNKLAEENVHLKRQVREIQFPSVKLS